MGQHTSKTVKNQHPACVTGLPNANAVFLKFCSAHKRKEKEPTVNSRQKG
jgi:hypothetical protein